MRKRFPRWLTLLAVLVVLVAALGTTVSAAGNPTEEPGSKMIAGSGCIDRLASFCRNGNDLSFTSH
mgnify:CR=1 FL=1